MSFDTLAVTALRRDLEPAIVGGRVQKVLLAGELSVGLEIYGRGRTCRLRICASNNAPHALLASKPLRRATDRETPLLQATAKVRPRGRILAVRQPPLERIVVLQIACRLKGRRIPARGACGGDDGRHSNVVLVDEAWAGYGRHEARRCIRQPVSVDPSETPLRTPAGARQTAPFQSPGKRSGSCRRPSGRIGVAGACRLRGGRQSARRLAKRCTDRSEGSI